MNKNNNTSHVRRVISDVIGKLEKNKVKKANAIIEAWVESTGEDEKCHAKPVSFRKGVLMVIVDNAPWLYKFTITKHVLLKKMNDAYSGRNKIKDIRFRVGNIEE